MGIVSARVADADQAALRRAGVNVSRLIRDAVRDAARRLGRQDALARLEAIARPTGTQSEDLVRAARDAH